MPSDQFPKDRPAIPPHKGLEAEEVARPPRQSDSIGLGVAVQAESGQGAVTARKAGGLLDAQMDVNPLRNSPQKALQNLAKGVNIAFQTDYGENYLEAVYQAAIVREDQVQIIHRDYFGFGSSWFGLFGRMVKSMNLTLQGPDPASPEGKRYIEQNGPSTLRGLLSLIGRKMDIIPEFEDRVPAFVEQMLDRLEASNIIVGWDRSHWQIRTTKIGLDVIIQVSDDVREQLAAADNAQANVGNQA